MNPVLYNLYENFFELNPSINKIVSIDIETTGFSNSDKIIEIGVCGFEFDGITPNYIEYSSLINPHMSIPKEAARVNGITDEMVAEAPEDLTVFEKLNSIIDGAKLIIMHNSNFDSRMLRNNYIRAGMDFSKFENNIRCSMNMAKSSKLPLKSVKLNDVAAYFGYKNEQAHRALSDAITTLYIYAKLKGLNMQ